LEVKPLEHGGVEIRTYTLKGREGKGREGGGVGGPIFSLQGLYMV